MKTISLILLISMIFYCCTSTHVRMHDPSTYVELNRKVEGEKAKITLVNDHVFVGENIFMGVDSTSFIVVEQWNTYSYVREWDEIGEIWSVPALDVKKIDVVSRVQGAKGGLNYGFLFGASLGTIFGIIMISDITEGSKYYDYKANIFVGSVALGGIAGAIVGLPFGLLAGGIDEYILTKIPEDSTDTGIESKELIRNK